MTHHLSSLLYDGGSLSSSQSVYGQKLRSSNVPLALHPFPPPPHPHFTPPLSSPHTYLLTSPPSPFPPSPPSSPQRSPPSFGTPPNLCVLAMNPAFTPLSLKLPPSHLTVTHYWLHPPPHTHTTLNQLSPPYSPCLLLVSQK